MEIRLSASDGVPVYRQILNQVKYLVASGRLGPGQELPTIRALAERLVVNPNTVVHAYAELEKEGVIICRHGSGTYVADAALRKPAPAAEDRLSAKIDSLLADAAHLNVDLEGLERLIRRRHAILKQSNSHESANYH